MSERRVVWFSCGATSALLSKLAVESYTDVEVVYCDTADSEHRDNIRFFIEVQQWLGRQITIIKSQKYATVDDVFRQRRYMSGPNGAICTTEMKKIPRFEFQRPDDVHLFGFSAEETQRIAEFEQRNPELRVEWLLRDRRISKPEAMKMLTDAGIALPAMYALGFKNNNCLGCVKATSPEYWALTRRQFPKVFMRRAEQSREIGARLVRYKGKRIFLDQLPPDIYGPVTENLFCGPECGSEADRV